MNIPYLCMNITLCILFVYSDWYKIQKQIINKNNNNVEVVIVKDEEKENKRMVDEKTTLL